MKLETGSRSLERLAGPVVLLLGLAILLILLQVIGLAFWQGLVINLGIFLILVLSLNLSNGFTGVFSLGHIGFMALDVYRESHDFSGWTVKKDLQAMIATGQIGSTRVILAKPTTFMNNSGDAMQKIQKFYRVYNVDTVVMHDELDVAFGTIRTRIGGGSAGHNGIKSITQNLAEDYGRIRIGIGPKKPAQTLL